MEQGKNNKGVITVLSTIIVILLVLVALLATGRISFEEKTTNNTQTSEKTDNEETSTIVNANNSYVGKYQYKDETAVDSEGNSNPLTFTLNLYDNGIFKYQLNDKYAPVGVIGNYTINNNELILNFLFNTGSSSDINVTQGIKKLTIDSNYNISGEVKSKDHKSNITVTFARTDDKVDEFDFNGWLIIGVHQQESIDEPNM